SAPSCASIVRLAMTDSQAKPAAKVSPLRGPMTPVDSRALLTALGGAVIATMAQPAPGAGIYYLPPFEAAARAFGIEPVEAPVRAQHKGVRHEHHAALLRQSRERGDDVGGINRDIIITQA